RRGYKSSTRVGFVAPLGNTKEDDYYRNDSPVEGGMRLAKMMLRLALRQRESVCDSRGVAY
ncbi:hypothetical protein B0H67DRAFT_574631, partial [Lasiosphaeris hirsuta]